MVVNNHDTVVSWYQVEATMTEGKNQQDEKHAPKFQIQIDRAHYTVSKTQMTGAELRQIPTPPIGPDRDLFEVVPGNPDRKIADTTIVEIRNGARFFTAPANINPGQRS
jgi:hypothetical protein